MYRVIGPGRAASVKTSGSPRKDARNRGGDDEGVVTPIDREGRRRTG
jgi:hypothetical protein